MAPKSDFEQKLAAEAAACRRCITALETVDPAAQRRVLAWLLDHYATDPCATTIAEATP